MDKNLTLTFRLMNGYFIKIPYENYRTFKHRIFDLAYIRIQKYILSCLECLEEKPKSYKSIVLIDPDGNKVKGEKEMDWNPEVVYSVYIDPVLDRDANVARILFGI